MTNFEIARRYTGLNGVALARLLGVSPQQLNGWLKGDRVPSRTSVEGIAAKMGVDAAWLLGVAQRLPVVDPDAGAVYSCGIVRTEILEGYGALYHVYLDETGDVVPVILSGGIQLTPRDWQALRVRRAEDIAGERWQDARGAEAVMLDGLPRVIT